MSAPQIVIDTNVVVSALRSHYGASHKLFLLLDSGKFEINFAKPAEIGNASTRGPALGHAPSSFALNLRGPRASASGRKYQRKLASQESD